MFTIPALLLNNPIVSILSASALVLAIALGVQTFRIESFKVEVADAKAETAQANAKVQNIAAQVAQVNADNERARANQEQKNNEERASLEQQRNTLQATLNQKQKEYTQVSTQLRSILDNAKDGVPISNSLRMYFAGLRIQQQQWHGPNNTTPTGNHN